MPLKLGDEAVVRVILAAKHDKGLDELTAVTIWSSHYGAFADLRVLEKRRLDLGARYVVAARDDHVVGSRLIAEVAVGVHPVHVAGIVPAVSHVLTLAIDVIEIATAGRPPDAQQPLLAGRQLPPVLVHHTRLVAGDDPAGGARPDLVSGPRR